MSANAIADHDPTQAVATACDVVAPGLTIGGWKQTRAPRMDNELVDLIKKHKIPHDARLARIPLLVADPRLPTPRVSMAARCGTSPGCGGPAPLRHAAWAWPAFQSWTGKLRAVASIAVRISG
jgi:hypothetical protein